MRHRFVGVLACATAVLAAPFGSAYADPPLVGAVQMVAEHEWFRTIELGMTAAAQDLGVAILRLQIGVRFGEGWREAAVVAGQHVSEAEGKGCCRLVRERDGAALGLIDRRRASACGSGPRP